MPNFTQNISNTVRCFGAGPSTKWGQTVFPQTMTWGTSKWGEGRPISFKIVKYAVNSQPVFWDKQTAHLSKIFEIGSVPVVAETDFESLGQGNWKYVFTSDTTDADDRSIASWTASAQPDATFTCQSAGSTSWSEV